MLAKCLQLVGGRCVFLLESYFLVCTDTGGALSVSPVVHWLVMCVLYAGIMMSDIVPARQMAGLS